MRPLLVLNSNALPAELVQVLESSHWAPIAVADPREALAAAQQHDVYVGLVLLTGDLDAARLNALRQAVYTLPGLRWVAAMGRRQAAEASIRQLIVERLYDYQLEPIDPLRLCHALGHAHGIAQIEQDLLRQPPDEAAGRYGMVGSSDVMRSLYEAIDRVAATDASLLIMGPTGSGKELVASAIHARSTRAAGPLVSLNCAAIPAALIQSELFGHRRGAFTSAAESRPGLIETAAGGTLFLDEIGEMPLESQSSLLRFLDNRRVRALGAEESVDIDVRIIAATNRDLEAEADGGRFRADLYYRLSVLTLRTPALKDRGPDIERLALHFLHEAQQRFGAVPVGFSRAALTTLGWHPWPGNVRELRSRVYQAAIQCERRFIEPSELGFALPGDQPGARLDDRPDGRPTDQPAGLGPDPARDAAAGPMSNRPSDRPSDRNGGAAPPVGGTRSLNAIRDQAEREAIQAALLRNLQNVRQAAADLQVSRMTLYRLMEKHGIAGAAGDKG